MSGFLNGLCQTLSHRLTGTKRFLQPIDPSESQTQSFVDMEFNAEALNNCHDLWKLVLWVFSFDFLKHEIINNFRWFRVQGSSHESLTLQHIGELKRQLCHLVSSFQSMSPAGEAKVIKKKS